MPILDQTIDLARSIFKATIEELKEPERRVLAGIAKRTHVARDVNASFGDRLTFGQRLADKVAEFGGSWIFISLFGVFLVLWTGINAVVLSSRAFDPYPFIFLNLILSMVAALQAPVIMMSQNRQSAKDRLAAEQDYEVNLKAELEIMSLHEKLDSLRSEELQRIVVQQSEQLRVLTELVQARR